MSLFTSYLYAPKVQDQAPADIPSTRLEYVYSWGGNTWSRDPYWFVETRHTEAYHYPGLTEAAAAAGAAAIQATLVWSGNMYTVEDGTITARAAVLTTGSAIARRQQGNVWQIDVSVDYSTNSIAEVTS